MWAFLKLMAWGLVWLITWPSITAYRQFKKKARIDNCFTWAIRRWQEEDNSYLVIRWCRSSRTPIKWPHFMWLPADKHQELKHFVPKTDDQSHRYFPDAFFEGKVVVGDDAQQLEN